jgi:hypothetical protein
MKKTKLFFMKFKFIHDFDFFQYYVLHNTI